MMDGWFDRPPPGLVPGGSTGVYISSLWVPQLSPFFVSLFL